MDELDFAILRQASNPQSFQWNVRLSYSELARAVGADEETVRLRVRRLQEEGVVSRWIIGVNPSLLGRTFVRFQLPALPPGDSSKVEEALRVMEGAILLLETYGGRLSLISYQEQGGAVERQRVLLSALAGGPVDASVLSPPPATVALKPLDWQIVQAFRRDPRGPFADIADRLGISERTLRRRVKRMSEGRAIFLNADIDFSRVVGNVPCEVRVVHGAESPRAEVDALLKSQPRKIFQWFEGPVSTVTFNAENLATVDALRRRLEAMTAGKAEVRVDLLLRRVVCDAWLEEEIARRVEPRRTLPPRGPASGEDAALAGDAPEP